LKEDRNTLKTLKAELQQLKEEHFDLKNEKEAVEKVKPTRKSDIVSRFCCIL